MSGDTPLLCTVCLLPTARCVCPYFHEPELCQPFMGLRWTGPQLDHTRPNPFTETPA